MERLCTRCARLSLWRSTVHTSEFHTVSIRSFSASTKWHEEGDNKPSSGPPPGQRLLRATRPPRDPNAVRAFAQRQQTYNPTARGPQSQSPGGGQLLQRTRPQRSGQFKSRNGDNRGPRRGRGSRNEPLIRVKYADETEAEVPLDQLLEPGKDFKTPEYVFDPEFDADDGQANSTSDSPDGQETEATDEEIEDFITKYVDRPANPTEPIPYQPAPQSHLELQKDWPDTPLSSTGLTATVVQKIEFLARRIPHGYQTPEAIAEHFRKGNLTRFESEEEKQQVLKIAQELAQKRADKLTDRKGEQVSPVDMTFSELSNSKDDKQTLVDPMVRGVFGEVAKQRMPFLDSIVRNLQNNQTYHKSEMDQFMAKIESLIPAQAGNKRSTPKTVRK